MNLTREKLETLYDSMSIDEMAVHLSIAKSTLYYYMRKFGVTRRNKSDAQRKHLDSAQHQRLGKVHSNESRAKISDGTRRFWESDDGEDQKKRLGDMRRSEWSACSVRHKSLILNRLQQAERPSPGQLSRFGRKLADFLAEREKIKTGIKLTSNHVSDIILDERKVVIELLLPTSIYGEEQENRIENRYDRLVNELNDAGYRVVVIEDRSNSISNARCNRIYEKLLEFFTDSSLHRITIVS